jgi:hypothetical protein
MCRGDGADPASICLDSFGKIPLNGFLERTDKVITKIKDESPFQQILLDKLPYHGSLQDKKVAWCLLALGHLLVQVSAPPP